MSFTNQDISFFPAEWGRVVIEKHRARVGVGWSGTGSFVDVLESEIGLHMKCVLPSIGNVKINKTLYN